MKGAIESPDIGFLGQANLISSVGRSAGVVGTDRRWRRTIAIHVLVGTGPLQQPVIVGALIGWQAEGQSCRIGLRRGFGTLDQPSMADSMTIGKGQIG